MKANRDGHSSYTTAGTVQTNPNILSPVAHSAQRSQRDNDNESDFIDLLGSLNHRAATLGARVVEKVFPPETSRLQARRHAMLDPPLFGTPANHSFSTMQVNISPLSKRNLSSLGYSGRSHTDRHDDPMSLTLLICLSSLNSDTDPGKFYIGETHDWCTLQPFSLMIFRGTGPHGGTQAIAQEEPDAFEKRINLILYPRKEFVNRTLPVLYPCNSSDRLGEYSFFDDGAACFGTEEYHKSWCGKELFRHMVTGTQRYGLEVSDSDLQKVFRTFTGSSKPYIDLHSQEWKDTTKEIVEAHDILESVRPHWKDAKSASKTAAEPEKLPQETIPPKQTTLLSTSQETAPVSTTWIQQDSVALRRSSRRASGTASTIQAAQEAAVPKHANRLSSVERGTRSPAADLESVRALTPQPPREKLIPRRSSGLSISLESLTPSTTQIPRDMPSPKLTTRPSTKENPLPSTIQPTLMPRRSTRPSTSLKSQPASRAASWVPVQVSGSTQTRNRKKIDDKLSESDEAYIPQDNASISDTSDRDDDVDDGSDSPFSNMGDIATSDVEIHKGTTVPITHRSVTASNRVYSLAQILQQILLFNTSTMNLEWEEIQN